MLLWQVVIVSDPGEDIRLKKWAPGLSGVQTLKRGAVSVLKEKRYIFDKAFDSETDTLTVYNQSVKVSLGLENGQTRASYYKLDPASFSLPNPLEAMLNAVRNSSKYGVSFQFCRDLVWWLQ